MVRKASELFGGINPASTADDYLEKSGIDLITDPSAIRDVRSYYESKGQTFSSDSEMWDTFYSDRRWRDTNSLSMAKGAGEYALAGSSQDLHSRLSKIWANAPSRGGFFDKVYDYGLAGVTDPLNLLAGAGVAKKAQTAYGAARAGMATAKEATKAATKAGAVQGAKTEAMLNAGVGGAFDAAQQATEIQQGVSDEFSIGRTAASAALDATVGGAFGALFGAYQGNKAAQSLTNWRENTAVGNDITRRAQRLDQDIATYNDEFNAITEQGGDGSEILTEMRQLEAERDTLRKVEASYDDFDKRLDEIATRANTARADNPQADITDIKNEFDALMKERADAFSKNVDDIITDLTPKVEPVVRAPEPEVEVEAPKADAPKAASEGEAAPKSEAGGNATGDADTSGDEVKAETVAEVKPIKFGKNSGTIKKLVDDGKVTVDELGRLVQDGTLEQLDDGNIKARYGKGQPTAYKKVQEYIKRRDAGEAPAEPAPKAEAPELETPEVIEQRPAEDYDARANEEFERLYNLFSEVYDPKSNPWAQMVPRILGGAKSTMDGQVYRRVAAKFQSAVELEKLGKSAPNASQVETLRAQFLSREGQTVPDLPASERTITGTTANGARVEVTATTDAATAPRSAGTTQKGMDTLSEGPVNAGRMDDGSVQGILRSGFKTGSEDGRTVSKLSDVPDVALFGAQEVRARAEMDEEINGTPKSLYSFTASGRERKATIADGNKLEKGQEAYYVPNAKKFFKSKKNAEKAAGIRKDDNYEIVAATAKDQDKAPVLTDEHYDREKKAITERFMNEQMTVEQLDRELAELDARTAGQDTSTETVKPATANALPDVAGKRGDKVIAAIPRDGNKFKTARIINQEQLDDGHGLNRILGKSPRDGWFIGYVDPGARNYKSNLERLKSELDPLDEANVTGVERAEEPELVNVAEPIDTSSPDYTDQEKGIDLATLTPEERTGLFMAIKMADRIYLGKSAKTGNMIKMGDVFKLEDLNEGKFALDTIDELVYAADNFSFRDSINIAGKDVEVNEDMRMLALTTVMDLRKQLAPNGIRRSTMEVKDSVEALNTFFDKISPKDRKQIERMFEMVSDENRQGPILGIMAERENGTLGQFKMQSNEIRMVNTDATNEVGASPTFVAAHELGHWVYRNLMTDDDIKQFWSAMRQQFAETGKMTDEAMETFISRQPFGDSQGDFMRPNEYFANQFALYMHNKHDMVMYPDKSFWGKVTRLAKKVFERLSGKSTYDRELEPLFDKLITRQDEKARVAYAVPTDANTSLGKILQARYVMLGEHALEATRRLDIDDIENFAFAMNKIADEFNSMATTEKGAKIIATKKGEPYNPEYTGVLEAIKPLAAKMRRSARLIKSVTGRYDQNIGTNGADDISGTAFFADMEEELKLVVGQESIIKLVDDVLEKLNEAYQAVEFGDIPEYKMSRETADLRRRVGMEKIAKSLSMKKALRAFKAEKARNKTYAAKMIEEAKKKADPNAKAANEDAPKINPNEVDLVTATREFQNQIDEKGNLTKLGKALSRRVAHILNTQGVLPYQRRTYSDLNNAELFLRYGQAIENGNEELIKKLSFEIQVRNVPIEIESPGVGAALEAEQSLNITVPNEVGVPANAPYMLRNALRSITHRTEPEINAARTMATRLSLLGHVFNPNVRSDNFKEFRKEMRQLASNAIKNDDITQSVRALARRLITSKAVPTESIDDIRRGAAEFGYDADEFIINVVLDDVDMNTDSSYGKAVMDDVRSARGAEFDDIISGVRSSMRESIAYVLNGLVPSRAARERFLPLFTYGDMSRTVSDFDPASPVTRFTDEVPAEFAEEFASEIVGKMSPPSRLAAQRFTGETNPQVYYVGSSSDARLDGMTFVSRRPENTSYAEAGNIIDQSDDPERMSQVMDILTATRNAINEMRAMGNVSPQRIEAMYSRERVIREEIERMGGIDTSMTTPVFVSNTKPLTIMRTNTVRMPAIQEVIHLIKSQEDPNLPSRAEQLEQTMGTFSAEQMFDMLSNAAGGARRLRRMLREEGYTTLQMPGRLAVLKDDYVKPIRSNLFDENGQDMSGLRPTASDINAHVVTEMSNRVDNGELGFEQASMALEIGGVRKGFVDVMSKVRRGGEINEEDGIELRRSFRHNILNSNAQIMRKSGMPSLADFFEPERGGGGHFERVSANMGKFIIPLTRKMRNLPDSGGFLKRWVESGIGQMYNATVDTGRRMLNMKPIHREQQPMSHVAIKRALEDDRQIGKLTVEERSIYNYIRSYLDEGITRLKDLGMPVGVIKRNYFPQIWRKDLIEADQDRFVQLMERYFLAEARADGRQLPQESARAKAIKVKNRLIATDGADPSDAMSQYKITADADDSFDFQRQIRLDEFPEFKDPLNPAMNLGAFLENDLLAIVTKYSDSLEQRIDFQKAFGPKAMGYHDYLVVQDQSLDGVAKLLSTGKVISRDHASTLATGERVHEKKTNTLFHPPFADEIQAQKFVKELALKAHRGASKAELQQMIMSRLDTKGEPSDAAQRMRKNFAHRAKAIANALHDSNGFLNENGQIVQVDKKNILHAEGFFRASLRKDVDEGQKVIDLKGASKWLRSVNAVTLLGFTTLSSMGDLILPLIRTGDFKATTQAWSKFMSDPVSGSAYRDMIRNIGAASENIVHQRMTKAFGVDNTRFTSGFFTTTLLTPWTDMNRDMAAAVAYEHFRAQARIAYDAPNTRQGRVAKRILDEAGLSDVYRRNLNLEAVLRSNEVGQEHPYREVLTSAIIKVANESIFTPNPNDIPLFAQTPGGAILFQLKSFPLMMTRLGRTVYDEAVNKGDTRRIAPLLYMAGLGPMFGAGVAFAKDVAQGRGGEDNREFAPRERALTDKFSLAEEFGLTDSADKLGGWYVDGLMQMGGLGLIGQLMYDSAAQLDNGAYGKFRTFELFLGPSLGIASDAFDVAAGIQDAAFDALGAESTNAKERAAVREVLGRIPVFGGVSAFREGGTDFIAGKRGD